MRTRILAAAAVALAGTFTIAATAPAVPAAADSAELFFSEYIEGTSSNKAIEIFNATGVPVDLAAGDYTVELYSNGSSGGTTGATNTLDLEGVIANGDVYVIANPSAAQAILDVADVTSNVTFFNGDDGLVLKKAGAVVDSFGQYGVDPGAEWLGGGADDTLIRKSTVCAGDTNFNDAFDASIEWDVLPVDTFSNLGSATADCLEIKPVINEFSASTTGTDVEYIEIAGAPATDLSNLVVLQIEGDSSGTARGTIDSATPVGTTDSNGLYLASPAAGALENGTITLLLVDGFTGAVANDLDTNDDGTLDVTPWTAIVDAVAVNDGGAGDLTYGAPVLGVAYDGLSFAPGGASRIPNGLDTNLAGDWVRNDFDLGESDGDPLGTPVFGEAYNTPGALNEAVPAPDPGAGCATVEFSLIHAIQGNGAASTMVGNTVTVEGIVVGDFQDVTGDHGDLNGFYLQEQADEVDTDPETSEGIFVADGSTPAVGVAPGDRVAVTGTVAENFNRTQLNSPLVEVCDLAGEHTDVVTPATPVLPVPGDYTPAEYFETFENMAVDFPGALTITEYFNFDRFGEIALATERLYTPTAVADPGADAAAIAEFNSRRRIMMDDGGSSSNRFPPRHPDGSVYTAANSFRGGDTLTGMVGVMDFSFSNFKIQPTGPAVHTVLNERPLTPPDVGGDLTVVGFNVLNYFSTLDDGPDICGPNADLDCRGADNETERVRQLDKIVNTIVAVDPAVAGLIEVGNPSTAVAPADDPELNDIVDELNAETAAGTYAFIATGSIGTDAIRQGLVYKPALVSPVGPVQILDSQAFVNPFGGLTDRNRPAVAQTFEDLVTGEQFVVAVNHLKSKGSSCPEVGGGDDPQQGSCNGVRTASAQVLADWLADTSLFPDQDIMILGDLNAYDHEDPIGVLEDAGYVDLEKLYGGEFAYSYVFDGQLGYLDYGMATASLTAQTAGAASWHTNSDEPDILDYDTTFNDPSLYADDPFRASDHDPVLVGLALDSESPMVMLDQAAGQADPTNGSVTFDITFSEVVTGFVASDVTLTGPVPASVQLDEIVAGLEYQLVLDDFAADGVVTASIAAGVVTDGPGNGNLASVSTDNSVTVDLTAPTVTIDQAASQADPTATSPVVFTVVFSEAVTGFGSADVALGGTAGATTAVVTGSGTTYEVSVSGMTSDGTITASVSAGAANDAAGNASVASTSTDNTVTLETVLPVNLEDATRYIPLNAFRLFDTRVTEPGNGPKGVVGPYEAIDVQIVGVGNVPSTAVAVVMNLTVTDTAGPSFVSAYPKGALRPTVSAVNIIEAGQTRSNLVTVPIGDDGMVTLYSLAGANLLADVAGYYVPNDEAVRAGRFVPLTPQRAFDTRPTELGAPGPKGKMDAGQTIDVQILGFGDVPANGVAAVVINITGTEASAPGFLTAFPTGLGIPFASNVNLATVGTTAPNLAIVPIGDNGMISIYSSGGTHALGDITGYITDFTADVSISGLFVPVVPERTFDSRSSEGGPGFVPPEGTAVVQVAGVKSIPANAGAVVLNIAGVDSPLGFLTAFDTGADRPTASTVNFVHQPLDTRANAAMLPIGEGGTISLYTLNGSDIIVDTSGYFLE